MFVHQKPLANNKVGERMITSMNPSTLRAESSVRHKNTKTIAVKMIITVIVVVVPPQPQVICLWRRRRCRRLHLVNHSKKHFYNLQLKLELSRIEVLRCAI